MDSQRIQSIYDEIEKYWIELEKDPTTLGPKYLNSVTSLCRHYTNAVTGILLELRRHRHSLDQALLRERTLFEVKKDELLAHDDKVKHLPNVVDRLATVNVILREHLSTISNLEAQLQDVDHVEKAVKLRHTELKATSSEIKLQRSLVRDELDTGSFYGEEYNAEAGKFQKAPGMALTDAVNEANLDKMLDEARSKPVEPEAPKAPPGDVDEDFLDALLSGVPQEPTQESTPKKVPEVVAAPVPSADALPVQEPSDQQGTQSFATEDEGIASFLADGQRMLQGASEATLPATSEQVAKKDESAGFLGADEVAALLDQL